jgi:hypothetical protein
MAKKIVGLAKLSPSWAVASSNTLSWSKPDGNAGFLRHRSVKNKEQQREFPRQIGENSRAH